MRRPHLEDRRHVGAFEGVLVRTLVLPVAKAVLLEVLADGLLVFDVGVEVRALVVTVPALAAHVVLANLLLGFAVVRPDVHRLFNVNQFFVALVVQAVVGHLRNAVELFWVLLSVHRALILVISFGSVQVRVGGRS